MEFLDNLFSNSNKLFHLEDIMKVLMSLMAGFVLGYEREVQNNTAGMKTISLICIGSTMFTIMSQNFTDTQQDTMNIASGIVTGIGFLGAGVIFKEGMTIYGMTTAGVIWVASAIGMAIGFGEYYLAVMFLLSVLAVIYLFGGVVASYMPNFNHRSLLIEMDQDSAAERKALLDELNQFTELQDVTKLERNEEGNCLIHMDIKTKRDYIEELENFLLHDKRIMKFSL
ncbi:MAG: MgtC/SapB family protein [Lautropia sp.]|nr:MgtC/SapB family protein [Lautropia sp.]